MAKSIGIIAKVRKFLSTSLLLNLYYAFAYPYLIYCNMNWASNYPTVLDKLNILQKRLIRLITFSEFRAHTLPLFIELKILNVQQICSFQTGNFMYRYCKGMLPSLFNDIFLLNEAVHSHYTRQSNLFHYFPLNSNVAKFSIKYNGPKIWNNIPTCLKELNYYSFKKQYRQFLIIS